MVDGNRDNGWRFTSITINQYQKPDPRKGRVNRIYAIIIFLIIYNIILIIKWDILFEGNIGVAMFVMVFINLMFIIGIAIMIYYSKEKPVRRTNENDK